MKHPGTSILLLGSVLLWAGTAVALDNDPALHRLCVRVGNTPETPCGSQPTGDVEGFRQLTKEYGLALSPALLVPAETMGINGFQFNLQFASTTISSAKSYWVQGIEDETPPGSLVVTRKDEDGAITVPEA